MSDLTYPICTYCLRLTRLNRIDVHSISVWTESIRVFAETKYFRIFLRWQVILKLDDNFLLFQCHLL